MDRDWSLIVGHEPGALTWVLLIACAGLALGEALMPLLTTTKRRGSTWTIVALRVLAIAALLAVVLELGVRVETFTGASRRVVVLVDHSASMDLADGPATAEPGADTTRRFDRVRALWTAGAEAREGWREQGVEVDVRAFAAEVTPLTRASAEALELRVDGPASDLSGALVELDEASASSDVGAPLAGVVIVSDGLVASDPAARRHLGVIVDALDVPVTTVAAGGPTIRDVAVAELHVGEFAFVENLTEFSAELISHGLAGELAEVSLLRNGEEVASERVRLGGDGERRPIRFEVAPDRTGQFVYEFRVAPLAGEASTANNRRAFIIKVLRDKVRVLHVAGRPDWDVRALRTLLKRDPNVELLSYYILRDAEDSDRDDPSAPLSLIAFPTDELFREQLGSFDLVVMHNFDARAHGDYLGNVADYVREGGSLVVIGGDLGLATGDFASPAFVRSMPIELGRSVGLEREPFRPRLSEAGRRHPITAWLAESGRADWAGLPALDSFNPAGYGRNAAEIGTAALLVHPSQQSSGEPTPLLAVAEPGAGRVMTLSTGATWRLGFAPDLPLIDGARPYDLLWLGAVRWLLRDASAERLVLEIDQAEHAVGEAVELSVRTLSASYAPEPEIEIEYDVRSLAPEHAGAPPVAAGRMITDGLGRASDEVEGLPAGAYQAEAWRADAPPQRAEDGEQDQAPELGQAARRVFLIGGGGRELGLVDADPGTALLRELAERSEGEHLVAIAGDALPEALPLADLDELERVATGRRDLPLWDGWWLLVVAIGAFGGEWIIRRRVGRR